MDGASATQPGRVIPGPNPHAFSSPAIPTIFRLPPEILVAILSQFCGHCQDSDLEREPDDVDEIMRNLHALSSISRACKRMKAFAQPVLHHRFGPFSNATSPARLYQFVRTLIQRQDLADVVQILGLDGSPWFHSARNFQNGASVLRFVVREETLTLMGQAASQFGFDEGHFKFSIWDRSLRDWEQGNFRDWDNGTERIQPQKVTWGLLIWLACCLCRNVKSINFGKLFDSYHSGILCAGTPPLKSNAQVVRIHGPCHPETARWGFHMGHIWGLTDAMPKLKTLQLAFARLHDGYEGMTDLLDEDPDIMARPLPGTLNLHSLTRLDLVLCSLSKNGLSEVLQACINLTQFTFIEMNHDLVGMVDEHVPFCDQALTVQPEELTEILQSHCSHLHRKLRCLTIEHLPKFGYSYDRVYSSIHKFTAVEELYLGANGLLTSRHPPPIVPRLAPTLPPNIVLLHIFEARTWSKQIANALTKLLLDIKYDKAEFTSLKEVRVSFRPMWPWLRYWSNRQTIEDGEEWYLGFREEDEITPRVEELAREVGIELILEPQMVPPAIQELPNYRFVSPLAHLRSAGSDQGRGDGDSASEGSEEDGD
jgi:hypothetical protein